MSGFELPPMLSWHEFIDTALMPQTIPEGKARTNSPDWAGASWDEALRLATDGWPVPLEQAHVSVGQLRERAGIGTSMITLEPTWDVTGSEVDIGAYLAGVPECMVDAVPRQISRRGKVITFLVPAAYSNTLPHTSIINRGLALATLCVAIIEAGHSVEIWSGFAGMVDKNTRCRAAARVISAGEPLDIGRLVFAVAHPAMCRVLWEGVWDGQDPEIASKVERSNYAKPPFHCLPTDLPSDITDPYLFPFLEEGDDQWDDLSTALDWCHEMFADLGLIT